MYLVAMKKSGGPKNFLSNPLFAYRGKFGALSLEDVVFSRTYLPLAPRFSFLFFPLSSGVLTRNVFHLR